ncbi:MAG: TetR/AcrR family transcriptional regulator [Myxococcota bacterium]
MSAAPIQIPESLRDRLVAAALEILAEEGIEALTLRSVARRVGVSHGAPARHFRSLSDLRAEVAAVGHRMLLAAMKDAAGKIPPDSGPLPLLAAAGRGYIDSALANPGLFALMFRPGDLDPENISLARDAPAAFDGLLGPIRVAQAAGWKPDHDARLLAGGLWSAVHGLATLWSQGALQKTNPKASLEEAIATTFTLTAHER